MKELIEKAYINGHLNGDDPRPHVEEYLKNHEAEIKAEAKKYFDAGYNRLQSADYKKRTPDFKTFYQNQQDD